MDKTPYVPDNDNFDSDLTVTILDSYGNAVDNLNSVSETLGMNTPPQPAHGFTFKLPSTISAGAYLIVATHKYMATATRTFVVQAVPSTAAVAPSNSYTGTFSYLNSEGFATTTTLLYGKAMITDPTGAPI